MSKHLKLRQEYIDRYDRHTVDICRRFEKSDEGEEKETVVGEETYTPQQTKAVKKGVRDLILYFQKGDRHLNKEKTIEEWMEADRKKDELYENTHPPEGIRCLSCRNRVTVTFKTLWYGDGKTDRVFFMFDCPNKCIPRRAFFSDGEEYRSKSNPCPSCGAPLKIESENDDGIKAVTVYSCSQCGNKKTDEYVWSKKEEEEIDENYAADRDRFVLTDKEGEEFRDMKWRMEGMAKLVDEWKAKDEALAKRLEENPQGFHLEDRGCSCSICGQYTPEGDNWYDQWGVKCLVCQKAIDTGEIPGSIAKNKDEWYSKWDIEKSFNVKGQTLRKWVRNGVIKPRIITQYGKGVHYELFMISDNEDVLPPKKLVDSEIVNVKEKDGTVQRRSVPWYQLYDPHERLKGYKIMDHLRVLSPDEVAERDEAQKKKDEAKEARRLAKREAKKKL